MTFRETDLAINMVKEKRKDENRETFATRSVALPYVSKGFHIQQTDTRPIQQTFNPVPAPVQATLNNSVQNASRPTSVTSSSVYARVSSPREPSASYRLLPVSDSVLKTDNGNDHNEPVSHNLTVIPSTVASYSEDLRTVQRIKEGEEYHEYSIASYSPNDEIDEGYRTNSSVASGSPSACSVTSFECASPKEDTHGQQLKNNEKVDISM